MIQKTIGRPLLKLFPGIGILKGYRFLESFCPSLEYWDEKVYSEKQGHYWRELS